MSTVNNKKRVTGALAVLAFVTWLPCLAQEASPTSLGYYEDALRYFEAQDYKAAIIQLKNRLRADPDDLPARLLMGRAHLKLENAAAAEKELRAARRLGADPDRRIAEAESTRCGTVEPVPARIRTRRRPHQPQQQPGGGRATRLVARQPEDRLHLRA